MRVLSASSIISYVSCGGQRCGVVGFCMAPSHPSGADLLAYYIVTAETVITAGVLHVEAKEHSHCETITVWVTVGRGRMLIET